MATEEWAPGGHHVLTDNWWQEDGEVLAVVVDGFWPWVIRQLSEYARWQAQAEQACRWRP